MVRFTLYYDGLLPPSAAVKEKQRIRQELAPQLKELWNHEPLAGHSKFLDPQSAGGDLNVLKHVAGHVFAPIVSTKLYMVSELHIEALRPEPPGGIITNQGDLDNRLKTLFDALRAPVSAQEITSNALPSSVNDPTFTLLEDDRLITGVTVVTDRLLAPPNPHPHYTRLTIRVIARPTRIVWGNLDLAG